MSGSWKLKVFLAQRGTFSVLPFFIGACACLPLQSLKSTFCLLHKGLLLLSIVLEISNTRDANTPDVEVHETLTTAVTLWVLIYLR